MCNKRPKISIISPSFNQGEFVENAILSVLNQKYDNFEHIIVDGNSTDSTIEVLKKYSHLKWVSEKDEGQSDAINKGFSMASGDIIGWLNTDEYYLPDTFSTIVEFLKDENIHAAYGNVKFINKKNELLKILRSHRPVKWLSLFHCYIPSASFFFKREILDYGIQIDKDMHICMDKDFFANILYNNFNLKYINKVVAAFTWHENNKSIDTKIVKEIRREEGLRIFNKHTSYNLPVNKLVIMIYTFLMYVIVPIRRILKSFDFKLKY